MKILNTTHFNLIAGNEPGLQITAVGSRIYVIDPESRAVMALTNAGTPDLSFDNDAIGYFPSDSISPFWINNLDNVLVVRGTTLPYSFANADVESIAIDQTGIPSILPTVTASHIPTGRTISITQPDTKGSVFFAPIFYNGGTDYVGKLLGNGAVDFAFIDNARSAIKNFVLKDIAVSADNSVYLAGEEIIPADYASNTPAMVLATVIKLLPSGAIDHAFGTNGRVNVGDKNSGEMMQIATLPNGDISVAYLNVKDMTHVVVTKLHSDGQVDSNFGNAGVSTYQSSNDSIAFISQLVTDGDLTFAVISHRLNAQFATVVPITERGFEAMSVQIPLKQAFMSATAVIDSSLKRITIASEGSAGYGVDTATIDYTDLFRVQTLGTTILGSLGDDEINAGMESNIIIATRGTDKIDGGGGKDTLQYRGPSTNFSITALNSSGFVVSDSTHREGTSEVLNVERLIFSDVNVALDLNGVAGQAYRLYQAAFDRQPDVAGLGYWISVLDNGLSLTAVASGFVASNEFRSMYAGGLDNAAMARQFYVNVLHRPPDDAGLQYWTDALDRNLVTIADVLVYFSESPENQAALIEVIGNGIMFQPWTG